MDLTQAVSLLKTSKSSSMSLPQAVQKVANPTVPSTEVTQLQTPSTFEQYAVPTGAAITDTGRGLENLAGLATGNPAIAQAMQAINDAKSVSEQPARDYLKANYPGHYYGMYAPTSVLSMAPFGETAASGAAKLFPALEKGAPLLARFANAVPRSALTGAAYGAQMPGNTGENMLAGAALGPLGEGLISGIGKAAVMGTHGYNSLMDMGEKMFQPQQAARKAVTAMIQETRTGGGPRIAPSVPGVSFTASNSSLDPGLQSLERAAQSRNVGGLPNEAVFQSQQRGNMTALNKQFGTLGNIAKAPEESSRDISQALQDTQSALKAQEKNLWGMVPENTPVNIDQTTAALDKHMNGLTMADRATLEKHAGEPIKILRDIAVKYANPEEDQIMAPFSEIKGVRSMLTSAKNALGNKMSSAYNPNAARIVSNFDNKLLSALGNENAFVPDIQDLGQNYNAARQFTSDLHTKYLTPDVTDMLYTDPSKVGNVVTSTPDMLDKYLNATSQAPDGGVAAKQAVRNFLARKAFDKAAMSSRGAGMDVPYINGERLNDFVGENKNLLGKVFNPDEIQNFKNIAQDAYRSTASESANPRVGSNTINKYLGNKGMDESIGKKVISKGSQAVTGGALGSLFGPVGASIGAASAVAGSTVKEALLNRFRGQTEKLLRDTLLNANDPEVQAILNAPPTFQNLSRAMNMANRMKAIGRAAPITTGVLRHLPGTASTAYLTQQAMK